MQQTTDTDTGTGTGTLAAALLLNNPAADPAIQLEGRLLTYGELTGLVESAAGELAATGLRPGDRVVLIFPNGIEHLVALLALTSLGAIAVPLGPDMTQLRLAQVIEDTGPRYCLADADVQVPAQLETRRLSLTPDATGIRFTPAIDATGAPPVATVNAAAAAVVRYSSGSTGQPKGVVLTHRQLVWTAQTLAGVFGLGVEHRELLLASMALSGGWQRVAATLCGGGCVIITAGPLSVQGMLEDLQSCQATGFFSPPPLLRMLLKLPADTTRPALRGCRTLEIGSAPLTAQELEQLMRLAPDARIFYHYGMTECSRAVILDARAFPDKLDSVGRAAPGVEVVIRDADNHPAEPGQAGQIHVRGPQLATGYWNRTELTRACFTDGWLATGDYGTLDTEGFLRVTGRIDDMINVGGHCFSPAEVEQALGQVDDVVQYLVASVPDPRGVLGQVPWAFVVPTEPDTWSPQDLLTLARARLPPHMVPRWVVPVPELPLTPSGKPDRRRTVELYAAVSQEQE